MSDNSDSEYDSEDDEDYVPEEPSSEEEADDGDGSASSKKQTKSKKKKSAGRKRKGGIKLEDEEVSPVEESEDDDEILPTKDRSRVDVDSKRVDDLWAAFKEETSGVRQAGTSSKLETKGEQVKKDDTSTEKIVKVTEIFDFAGEEVRVEKSVDVSSPKVTTDEVGNVGQSRKTFLPSKRPCGGLSSVLGKIGKKPKMSTLEKSKLDWNSFKKDEGIEDELKTINRDGYLEKQAFLSRVDHKQFELERDVRQGVRKR